MSTNERFISATGRLILVRGSKWLLAVPARSMLLGVMYTLVLHSANYTFIVIAISQYLNCYPVFK